MYVSDKWHRTLRHGLAKRLRRLKIRHRKPHDISASFMACAQMRRDCGGIVRIVGKHRLHAHQRAASNRHFSDHHLSRH
jgi:hypothetical protein